MHFKQAGWMTCFLLLSDTADVFLSFPAMLQHCSGVTDATGSSITTVITALNGFNFGRTIHFDTELSKITTLSVLLMWVERVKGWKRPSLLPLSTATLQIVAVQERVRVDFVPIRPLCFWAVRRPRLWLWVQPVPVCRKSEWVFVGDQTLPSSSLWSQQEAEKAERDPGLYSLFKKKRRRKIRVFFFLIQSCREPPSSVAFRVQMRWTPPATRCRRSTPWHYLYLC